MNLQELPQDIISCIVHHLSPKYLIWFSMSCKSFSQKSNPMWESYCRNKEEISEWKYVVWLLRNTPAHMTSFDGIYEYDDPETLLYKSSKWANILGNWKKYSTKHRNKQSQKAIEQGIPTHMRGYFWRMCLDINNFPSFNYLETEYATKDDSHLMDRSHRRSAYKNVLRGVIAYDNAVMYSPALGVVVSMLLTFLEEEEAFRALATLLGGKYNFKGMFKLGIPKARPGQNIIRFLIDSYFPQLQFNNLSIVADLSCIPLTGIFSKTPSLAAVHLWDMIMFDGYHVIYAIFLAGIHFHQEKFSQPDFAELHQLYTFKDINPNIIPISNSTSTSTSTSNSNSNSNPGNKEDFSNSKPKSKKNKNKKLKSKGLEVENIGVVVPMNELMHLTYKYLKKISKLNFELIGGLESTA